MPLEQTDMNVGFNSGADKVSFPRQGILVHPFTLVINWRLKHQFSVIFGNPIDCLPRNQ